MKHFLYDILPYIYCCELTDNCDAYFEARPSITDYKYESPPPPIIAFGDPHLKSFDNVNFDFHGVGEYVAFCGKIEGKSVVDNLNNCQPSSTKILRGDTTSVHYRLSKRFLDESGNPNTYAATVIVGVAIESPLFRKGQIPLSIVTHSVERLRVYDGGSPVSFPAAKKNKKKRKRVSGAKLYLTPNTNSTNFEHIVTYDYCP